MKAISKEKKSQTYHMQGPITESLAHVSLETMKIRDMFEIMREKKVH